MIIGVAGKMLTGKDTVAGMLQYLSVINEYVDYSPKSIVDAVKNKRFILKQSKWENKKFAYKLKQIASILTGLNIDDFEKQEFKNSTLPDIWHSFDKNNHYVEPDTVRELLQKLGTDAIRNNIHTNAWVNALFSEYTPIGWESYVDDKLDNAEHEVPIYPKWIITDIRFPNELEAVTNKGGITIKMNRPQNHTSFNDTKNHVSETALNNSKFDHIINNDGTLEDLAQQIIDLTQTFKYKDEFKRI